MVPNSRVDVAKGVPDRFNFFQNFHQNHDFSPPACGRQPSPGQPSPASPAQTAQPSQPCEPSAGSSPAQPSPDSPASPAQAAKNSNFHISPTVKRIGLKIDLRILLFPSIDCCILSPRLGRNHLPGPRSRFLNVSPSRISGGITIYRNQTLDVR